MKTRQDLIVATLKKLNVLAVGQSPEPEDVEEIDDILDGKLDDLNRRGLVWVPDHDQFDDVLIDPIAIILASMSAPAFGQASKPESVFLAENNLRELRDSDRVSADVTPSLYF